jgi:DNA repair exonuclease SbcCD ATPase subunit
MMLLRVQGGGQALWMHFWPGRGAHYRNDPLKGISDMSKAQVVFLFSLFAFVHTATADDRLKDFQNAINYMQDDQDDPKGKACFSIPYPDYQDECLRKQEKVNDCKDRKSNCQEIDPKGIQRDIEDLKRRREELKAKKEDLERQRSSLSDDADKREVEDKIKTVDNEIGDVDRVKERLQKDVEETTKEINKRLDTAKVCLEFRVSVQDVFAKASSNADREQDADIAPLAKQLVVYWDKGAKRHEEATRNAKRAIDNCENVLYDIGHLGSF